jgi:hypothetical protein
MISVLQPCPGACCRTLHCDVSGWQQQYLEVHRQIISRRAPPRFMLAYGLNGALRAALCSCLGGMSYRRATVSVLRCWPGGVGQLAAC